MPAEGIFPAVGATIGQSAKVTFDALLPSIERMPSGGSGGSWSGGGLRGDLIVDQTQMTGTDPLAATDYITKTGRWLVTAHATVRTPTTATGRLECVIADIGAWPAGPSPEVDVDLGGGRPAVGFAHASFIALADGGSPILVGGRYYPSSGDIDEAWLVWRAYRLGPV